MINQMKDLINHSGSEWSWSVTDGRITISFLGHSIFVFGEDGYVQADMERIGHYVSEEGRYPLLITARALEKIFMPSLKYDTLSLYEVRVRSDNAYNGMTVIAAYNYIDARVVYAKHHCDQELWYAPYKREWDMWDYLEEVEYVRKIVNVSSIERGLIHECLDG